MAKEDSEGREALLASGGAISLVIEDWLRSVVHFVRCKRNAVFVARDPLALDFNPSYWKGF